MKNKMKKRLSAALVFVMAFLTLFQSAVLGAEGSSQKEKPFPSQSSTRMFSMASVNPGNIGNDFIQASIGSDGRFSAGLKEVDTDNWYNIIYGWSGGTGTSFTSLKVDGEDLIYGNEPDGSFITHPINSNDNTKNESVWKTGDISVKQVLQPGLNPATGQPDALQIRYIITNTGAENHEVGLRMMHDTMVNGNDYAPFKVPGTNGVESVDYERDYLGAEVPAFWQAFYSFDNPNYSAQYTMSGRDATAPDRFTIANWGRLVDSKWDFNINAGNYTGDSAVAMWWNPDTLAPGEQKIITTYYGIPGVGGDEALVLSGRQLLTHEEWSSAPFNLISYFTNITGSTLNNVRLEIENGPGIDLVDSEAAITLGDVDSRSTNQVTWKVQPNSPGTHTLTVNAYADGSEEPLATATYQVEALEPVVPPNITLEGERGTSPEGTPTAGRLSPLTVNASYNDPRATGVILTATDADGSEYHADMTTSNNVDWSHTFIPDNVGLWEDPMTITVTPHYEDGSTGTPQQFEIVLIDPSGYIYNEEKDEDWRLPGATVVLQYFDPDIETWVNMNIEAYPGRMSPITNPQVTGEDGRYAWDTAAGTYRVVVSRPGFETTTSDEVTVPPEVTDLHVALTPTDRVQPVIEIDGVENGESYSEGTAIHIDLSASDDEAGIRYITYKVDGEDEVKINGDTGDVPAIGEVGQHTVILKAVDHAGNEILQEINFEIKSPEESEGDIMAVVTAAIEKSKLAEAEMKEAMGKINASASEEEIKDYLEKAKAANAEAKVKTALLKELLESYSSSMPSFLHDYIKNLAVGADLQTSVVDRKLAKAIELLATDEDNTRVKARLKEAQSANASSIASLSTIKGNLIIFPPLD
ncbi:carboxypeptidase-like regulatory domain-containing protein [Bacillus sp. ISL-55]|uniref:carboxypeptidase-like regulatory domain-containing protein n=1 Tax=Bacillus sp. ISL-55 TaxID=2819134 RepID=UPI001BEC2066|nr:carboxypeptidase-like regulatory domain-containing protein [Bacillus sp. ISL-55]MBT2692599.1 carboxypeptidase regulatory-like domain-containing protein [Bacillus sp. ISL-55]